MNGKQYFYKYYENLVNPTRSKVMKVFYPTYCMTMVSLHDIESLMYSISCYSFL